MLGVSICFWIWNAIDDFLLPELTNMYLLVAGTVIGEVHVTLARRIKDVSNVFDISYLFLFTFCVDGLVTSQCYAIESFLLRLVGLLCRNMNLCCMEMFVVVVLSYDILP